MYYRKQFLQTADRILGDDGVLALVIVKCCRYREINSAYGIDTADSYITQFEHRLKEILRQVDVVTRIGDCEFGLLLPSLNNKSHAMLAVNKIISEFRRPFMINANTIEPRIVIGLTTTSENGPTRESMLQQAERALLKEERCNQDYCIWDASDEEVPSRLVIEQEMINAYEQEEFSLYYQPKVDLATHSVVGVEALLRWFSPRYGAIDTQYFINILEGSRLLMPLTK